MERNIFSKVFRKRLSLLGSCMVAFCTLSLFYITPGCGGGSVNIGVSATTDLFAIAPEQVNPRMDILWVVDNSISMRPFIANVQNNAMSFVQTFIEKGFDFNLGVISTTAWAHYAYKANSNDMHGVMFNTLHSGEVLGLDSGSPILTEEHITVLDTAATTDNALFIALQFPDGYDINRDGDFNDTVDGVVEYQPPTFPITVGGVTYTSPTDSDVPGSPSFYDSFIYKFRVNFDVYGFKNGTWQTGGYLAKGRLAGATGQDLNRVIGDEKGVDSLRAFVEFGDEAKTLLTTPSFVSVIDAERASQHPGAAPTDLFASRSITGFSDFSRGPEADLPPAFFAVIMISDENDGSRFDDSLVGTTPVDLDGDGLMDYGQLELIAETDNDREHLTGSGISWDGTSGYEDLWAKKVHLDAILDYVKRQGLEDESKASYFYDSYTIAKKDGSNRSPFWGEFTGYDDAKWFDISDPDYSDELSEISTNIIQAATVYQLNCEPQISSISVTFKKEGEADVIVPVHDPSHPTDPELNGYEYVNSGSQYFLRFYADSIPEAGMTMEVLYDPVSLGCEA